MKQKKCEFCDKTIYIKINKYLKTITAPMTPAEALRQKLEDMTGEKYVRIQPNYCPMCGAKIEGEQNGRSKMD